MNKSIIPSLALILSLTSVALRADIKVPFSVPRDGRVSLALYDKDGRMVRTLLTGKPLAKGKHTITWDGLDRYGNALPAGEYTWKLLATEGLRAEFITQVGQNVDPVWEKATGNHQSPNAAAVDASGLYRQGSVNEGGHWGVKTDLNGRTLWVNDRNQADRWMGGGEALTLVNGRLFELMRDGTVYGSDAASGRVFTGSDTQPKPWNLRWESYVAPAGTPDDARRKRNIAERPHDLAGDAANQLLVAAYPQHDAIAWFDARDGRQVDKAEGISGLAGIAVSADGTVFAIAQGRVIALSRQDKTPRVVIAAEHLQNPWRLAVSPKTGDLFVAENSDLAQGTAVVPVPDVADGKTPDLGAGVKITPGSRQRHHQVKRFTSDGQFVKAFGRAEGRADGAYVPTDFRRLTDIEADAEGGFVVTEGNHTPPRRTARFAADGKLLREWIGAQHYGIIVCPEPNDLRHVWFMANADQPALVRCEVDYDKKTWRVAEIYQDVFTRNSFARVPAIPTLFAHGDRIYIQGGGVQPGGLTLSVYDPAGKQLRPCNASGSRNKRNYLWNDLNDDGQAPDDEVEWLSRNQLGGFVNPDDFLLATTVHATGYQPGHLLAPDRFTAGGTPVYASAQLKKHEPWVENGKKNFPYDCRRGPDGHWYACFADSFSNPNEGVENHGAWYYNSCSAFDRLVKWDKDWKPLWSIGKHSSDDDHELGTTAMPRGLVGFTHGCVVLGDASDEEAARPSVRTEDGLFVDELLRVPTDMLRKEEYGEENTNEYDAADQRTDEKANYPDMVRRMDANVGRIIAKLDALGLRERTLVLFTGDNGSKNAVEMKLKDGTVYPGGKGKTSDSGVHVPLIVNQPGRVPTGVSDALVGFTDFLPTIAEIAGVKLTKDIACDGQSFLAHCLGKKDAAGREWNYQWFANNPQVDKVVEVVFDREFRLYGDGRFFHWSADLHETKPLDATQLAGPAKAAHTKLQAALQSSRAGFQRPLLK